MAARLDVPVDAVLRWRADPPTFVREIFDLNPVTPDEWQDDALRLFGTPAKRHALVACKGPGKTAELAWAGLNFLVTRPQCRVPCASITGINLRDNLWAEFAKWMKRSTILTRGYTWTKTRIFQNENPETWFASFKTWRQDADPTQQANTIAGAHEDYLLWLLDESSEMPDGVVSAAEGALTGGIETKLMIAGNCTRTSGPLYRAAVTEKKDWCVTKITGDPDDPKRSPRIDIEECRKQIEKHGRDSYIVKVNILGEFPDRQADKLLDRADVEAAMDRHVAEGAIAHEAKIIGVDVALFGDDSAKFAPRQGLVVFPLREFRNQHEDELGDHLIRSIVKWDADMAFVDGTGGYGHATVRHCHLQGYMNVREVGFGSRASEPDYYDNKRVEMYWLAREFVLDGGCLPRDPLLAEELCAPIYWHDKKGRICLEPKPEIKARIGRSPDAADSVVLTFAAPVLGKSHPARRAAIRGRVQGADFNPFQ